MRTDGHMTKVAGGLLEYANAPKSVRIYSVRDNIPKIKRPDPFALKFMYFWKALVAAAAV
jgi:hypothetical protein